jgi:hypothetical protein
MAGGGEGFAGGAEWFERTIWSEKRYFAGSSNTFVYLRGATYIHMYLARNPSIGCQNSSEWAMAMAMTRRGPASDSS